MFRSWSGTAAAVTAMEQQLGRDERGQRVSPENLRMLRTSTVLSRTRAHEAGARTITGFCDGARRAAERDATTRVWPGKPGSSPGGVRRLGRMASRPNAAGLGRESDFLHRRWSRRIGLGDALERWGYLPRNGGSGRVTEGGDSSWRPGPPALARDALWRTLFRAKGQRRRVEVSARAADGARVLMRWRDQEPASPAKTGPDLHRFARANLSAD